MGVPPHHIFVVGIFHEIYHPAIGVPPMTMETSISPDLSNTDANDTHENWGLDPIYPTLIVI